MSTVRLGAVGFLNTRPLVYGLTRVPRFNVRYDTPSRCAMLLHEGAIDVGLIPSIEYLRDEAYRIAPGLAIGSRGPVASVALYTTRAMSDVGSIAIDTSSRTSVALVRVLCARLFKIRPSIETLGPDLGAMLERCDAALIIGDNALLLDHTKVRVRTDSSASLASVEKIDLGEAWTALTGLPFVYAFWAGRPGVLTAQDVGRLQEARDCGVTRVDEIAREYFPGDPVRQAIGARYLRDNIRHDLGDDEQAGLQTFYRYAVEAGVTPDAGRLRFY